MILFGSFHSFNDMPSRIFFDASVYLGAEWHKNGAHYRKNFKYNKILIQDNMV